MVCSHRARVGPVAQRAEPQQVGPALRAGLAEQARPVRRVAALRLEQARWSLQSSRVRALPPCHRLWLLDLRHGVGRLACRRQSLHRSREQGPLERALLQRVQEQA